jgi:hypothetical protein
MPLAYVLAMSFNAISTIELYMNRPHTETLQKKPSDGVRNCRKRFLRFFLSGFQDQKYVDWERGYKWAAHEQWNQVLNKKDFKGLLENGKFADIAAHAIRIESKTNLLFSFEKIAVRDAVKTEDGAQSFAMGLFDFLYGAGKMETKFENWCAVLAELTPQTNAHFDLDDGDSFRLYRTA